MTIKLEYEHLHRDALQTLDAIRDDVGGLSEGQISVYAHVAATLMAKAAHQGAEDHLNGRPDPLSARESANLYLALPSGTALEAEVETALGPQAMGARGVGMRIASWSRDCYQRGRRAAGEQVLAPA